MGRVTEMPRTTRYMAAMTFRSTQGMTAAAPFEVRAIDAEAAHQMARATVAARPDFRSFIHTSVEVIGS